MLTEDQVVAAVANALRDKGWTILRTALATERGEDIVAERDGERLVIEAKGEGSSKEGSRRFGQTFSRGQVFSHVSVATTKALRVVARGNATAGLAFPDNDHHRSEVAPVEPALDRLGIVVVWVSEATLAVDGLERLA